MVMEEDEREEDLEKTISSKSGLEDLQRKYLENSHH